MESNFLLPQSRLNPLFLSFKQQEESDDSGLPRQTITYFEDKKSIERYLTEKYLLDIIVKQILSIRKALYPNYALLFLFDHATSYSLYR